MILILLINILIFTPKIFFFSNLLYSAKFCIKIYFIFYETTYLDFHTKIFFFQNTRLILILALMPILYQNVKASDTYNDAYMFGYEVNSNEYDQKQNFGQMEHRNKNEVKGEWYVKLPDGQVQHVSSYVDKYSGFVVRKRKINSGWTHKYSFIIFLSS